MIIYGHRGMIGSRLKEMVANDYKGAVAYLYGRSDGNTKEEFFRQINTLNHTEEGEGRTWPYQKIVYASSIHVDKTPFRGTGTNYYTLTKEYTEHYFKHKRATGLRLCAVYGPGGKGIINKLLDYVKNGTPLKVGDIHTQREFMYVDDACRWVVEAIERREKIIEAGSGEKATIRQIMEWVGEITRTKLDLEETLVNTTDPVYCKEQITNPTPIKDGIEKLWKELSQ